MNPNETEAALHEELRGLPNLRAPDTLVQRVQAVLADRARRPWWQQPWLAWPRSWQAASGAGMLALIGLCWWVEPAAMERARSSLEPVSARWASLEMVFDALAGACRWFPNGAEPLELFSLAATYLLCVGLIIACFRIAARHA